MNYLPAIFLSFFQFINFSTTTVRFSSTAFFDDEARIEKIVSGYFCIKLALNFSKLFMKYLLQKNVLAQFFHSDNMMKIFLTFNKNNMHKFRSVQKAFTLIELLIVIAIIGILTVIFLPTLRGGQAKARDASKKALIENLVVSFENKINEGGWTMPTSVGACIANWSTSPGSDIAAALGRSPEAYPAITTGGTLTPHLCAAGVGIYYKKFAASNSYMFATEMENFGSANVKDTQGTTAITALTDNAEVIALTNAPVTATGDSDGKYFYVIAK